jgi:transposase
MDRMVIGIDVAKAQLDVAVWPSGEAFTLGRDAAGLAALIDRLRRLAPDIVVLEATGGLEAVPAAALGEAGLPVAVVNPRQVRAFAEALGQRAKTDRIDAAVIARFADAAGLQARPMPDAQTTLLAALMARRRQIVEMRLAEQQRRERAASAQLRKSIDRILRMLDKELARLESDIDDRIQGSPAWRAREDILRSVPGVGPIVARTLIAELPELGALSRKQIAALAGLAPFTRQSGQWRGRSHIGGGRQVARTALYQAALVAARHNPLLSAFYQALLAAGKAKMVALIAVARKLLTILNAMIRDQTTWQAA